jgi:signal transduction histidine kinase
MRDLGIDNLQTVGPPVLTQKMGFAVRAGNTDLLSKLNEGLYTLQTNGEYDKIFLKWFSINEQKRILSKVIQVGKMVTIPLVVVLAVLGFFIWYLNKTVERKTRTIQLREGLLNSIVQGIPAPTLVSDPSGKISHWNRACEKMSGLTASELVGTTVKKIPDRSHPSIYLTILAERFCVHDELDLMWRPMNHSDRQSEVLNAEVYVPWLGDQGRWLYGTIAPFLDEQARPLGVIESWQDFTDKKELETQLLQAQKMEAIGTMARGVAHDFNNYLHVIKSLSESARKETSKNSEGYGYLQQIDKTIQNAADLIKQILTFGHKNLKEPTPIFVKPIVEKTLKMIISMAPDHIDIRQKLASNAMIMADGTQVGQVIMNLCTNALQSMEGRQGILEVQLKEVELSDEYGFNGHGAKSGNFIKLIVSDTGQGIHPEQLNRIFEPFFSTRKNSGGSGMGLAIAHGIVQGYGGKISVASALAQGSRFEVLWPIIEMPANKK